MYGPPTARILKPVSSSLGWSMRWRGPCP
jgi:hypothetical protein